MQPGAAEEEDKAKEEGQSCSKIVLKVLSFS